VSGRAKTSLIALFLFVAYALFVVIAGILGSGHGPGFWAQIVVTLVLAAAALWVARWIYRRGRPSGRAKA
jgi:membrane protein implicated in regulation of membrane protease activity